MSDMMTLARFYGSTWYFITMIAGLVVLIIVYKVVRGRAG
jgi:hypothetical protein